MTRKPKENFGNRFYGQLIFFSKTLSFMLMQRLSVIKNVGLDNNVSEQ